MKRISLLLTLSLLSFFGLHAQQTIDSLRAITQQPNVNDSVLIQINLQLAQEFYNIDLKESIHYAQEGMQLAQLRENEYGIQTSLSMLSRIHRRLGNFSVAIEYNLEQIRIALKRNDLEGAVDAYTTLGNIHSSLGNYREAKQNLFEAYTLGESIKVQSLSSIMNFIGRNYGKMGVYDSAETWILKALDYETILPQPGYGLSYIYNNLAEVYLQQKLYDAALNYYTRSQNLPASKKSHFGQTFTLNGLARIYLETKQYQDAIRVALESIDISTRYGYRDKTKESYGILYEIYENKKDYYNALAYYKKFNLYQDSIFSEDRLQYVENLKINYETDQVAQENELLKKNAELKDARIDQQKLYTAIGVMLSLSITGAFIFLFSSYRQNKKRNELLSSYNTNLETQVEERTKELVNSNLELIRQNNQLEQFAYITAHNLRAPVARILGLTNIIRPGTFDMEKDAPLLDRLNQTAKELDTIIHDMNGILEVKKGAENAYEVVDFHERIQKIRSILSENIVHADAVIEEELDVKSCFAVPAYVESILYNLISNSIKYRSPKRRPLIKIQSRVEDSNLVIIVSDNGIGIDLDRMKDKVFSLYQRFHDHVEGKGIGLFLVRSQVEAMNGSIDIESHVNEGTRFIITIPLKLVR